MKALFAVLSVIACAACAIGDARAESTAPSQPRLGVLEDAKVTKVIDGDTIEVLVNDKPFTVRYIGIDAPEAKQRTLPSQCYADQATAANRALVEGQAIKIEKDKSNTDRYKRLLRYVYLSDGRMVNEVLVRDGAAFAKRFAPDIANAVKLEAAQAEALAAKKGLWGVCNVVKGVAKLPVATALPVAPAATVVATPVTAALPPAAPQPAAGGSAPAVSEYDCPATHPVKGNIRSKDNAHIFHVPGSRYYKVTKPEVCFASPADALAAGFRAPL